MLGALSQALGASTGGLGGVGGGLPAPGLAGGAPSGGVSLANYGIMPRLPGAQQRQRRPGQLDDDQFHLVAGELEPIDPNDVQKRNQNSPPVLPPGLGRSGGQPPGGRPPLASPGGGTTWRLPPAPPAPAPTPPVVPRTNPPGTTPFLDPNAGDLSRLMNPLGLPPPGGGRVDLGSGVGPRPPGGSSEFPIDLGPGGSGSGLSDYPPLNTQQRIINRVVFGGDRPVDAGVSGNWWRVISGDSPQPPPLKYGPYSPEPNPVEGNQAWHAWNRRPPAPLAPPHPDYPQPSVPRPPGAPNVIDPPPLGEPPGPLHPPPGGHRPVGPPRVNPYMSDPLYGDPLRPPGLGPNRPPGLPGNVTPTPTPGPGGEPPIDINALVWRLSPFNPNTGAYPIQQTPMRPIELPPRPTTTIDDVNTLANKLFPPLGPNPNLPRQYPVDYSPFTLDPPGRAPQPPARWPNTPGYNDPNVGGPRMRFNPPPGGPPGSVRTTGLSPATPWANPMRPPNFTGMAVLAPGPVLDPDGHFRMPPRTRGPEDWLHSTLTGDPAGTLDNDPASPWRPIGGTGSGVLNWLTGNHPQTGQPWRPGDPPVGMIPRAPQGLTGTPLDPNSPGGAGFWQGPIPPLGTPGPTGGPTPIPRHGVDAKRMYPPPPGLVPNKPIFPPPDLPAPGVSRSLLNALGGR